MILYTNLKEVFIINKEYKAIPVIKLTSTILTSSISSNSNSAKITEFITQHDFSKNHKEIIEKLFDEVEKNNFLAIIEKAE